MMKFNQISHLNGQVQYTCRDIDIVSFTLKSQPQNYLSNSFKQTSDKKERKKQK